MKTIEDSNMLSGQHPTFTSLEKALHYHQNKTRIRFSEIGKSNYTHSAIDILRENVRISMSTTNQRFAIERYFTANSKFAYLQAINCDLVKKSTVVVASNLTLFAHEPH